MEAQTPGCTDERGRYPLPPGIDLPGGVHTDLIAFERVGLVQSQSTAGAARRARRRKVPV